VGCARREGGEGARHDRTSARDELGVDEPEPDVYDRCERKLLRAHRERLFPKPSMSCHVEPPLGRQEPPDLGCQRRQRGHLWASSPTRYVEPVHDVVDVADDGETGAPRHPRRLEDMSATQLACSLGLDAAHARHKPSLRTLGETVREVATRLTPQLQNATLAKVAIAHVRALVGFVRS
jgi:hypothetical protein